MGTSEGDFKFQFLCVGLKIETLTMFFSAEQKAMVCRFDAAIASIMAYIQFGLGQSLRYCPLS